MHSRECIPKIDDPNTGLDTSQKIKNPGNYISQHPNSHEVIWISQTKPNVGPARNYRWKKRRAVFIITLLRTLSPSTYGYGSTSGTGHRRLPRTTTFFCAKIKRLPKLLE
jgi:hypothetical protein